MRRIFVYEHLSGKTPAPGDSPLLADGLAMRNALVDDLLHVPGVSVSCATGCRPDAATLPAPAGARLAAMAPHEHETPADFVRRMAYQHDACWVVAPETDGVLASLHAAVDESRWIGCSGPAIRIASSKRTTLLALHARGIATPMDFAAGHRGRWIVKPDDGAGSTDTRVHLGRESACVDLYRRECAGRSSTLEPFVEGEALSISVLAGPDGSEAIALNRQQLRIDRAGLVHDLGVHSHAIDAQRDPRAAGLHALARQVVQALPGLHGFIGIDLVWHAERGPVAIEVNPRVTCAYVGLSTRLGRNLAGEVLSLHRWHRQHDAAAA